MAKEVNPMKRKYILIVRDKIHSLQPNTDESLACLDCLYKSSTFTWNGSLSAANAIIDKYYESFSHMIDWTATFVPV
jgi:hypothetical protein